MRLYEMNADLYKVDGGAFFGVVPRSSWAKVYPPDDVNRVTIATRSLLVETGNRRILIDTGMGNKQNSRFFSYHNRHGEHALINSLEKEGFSADDITDVLLTHLHFDHSGGAINQLEDGRLTPAFKNATYWSNEKQWKWALHANERETHSFIPENIHPIEASGQLSFLSDDECLIPELKVEFVYGHTEALMIPHIQYKDTTLVFVTDLIPSVAHMSLPYVMAYDIRPLETMREKKDLLRRAIDGRYVFFFQHDAMVECCTVRAGEKQVQAEEVFALKELDEITSVKV